MTNKIDKGGPAFPANEGMKHDGMTLRDYFAAKAMQAHIQAQWSKFYNLQKGESKSSPFDVFDSEDVAELAYEQADAMLEARK